MFVFGFRSREGKGGGVGSFGNSLRLASIAGSFSSPLSSGGVPPLGQRKILLLPPSPTSHSRLTQLRFGLQE